MADGVGTPQLRENKGLGWRTATSATIDPKRVSDRLANPRNRAAEGKGPVALGNANGAGSQAGQAQSGSEIPPLAVIYKNRASEVRVALTEFKGHDLVDVRVFARPFGDVGGNPRATREGVSLNVAKLPELIRGLQAAWAEAKRRGVAAEA